MLRWTVTALDLTECTYWWKVTTMSSQEPSALDPMWIWSSFNMWDLGKRLFSSALPERKWRSAIVHGPWVGEFGEHLFQDRLVFWLGKSGLEASSSPVKTGGGRDLKRPGIFTVCTKSGSVCLKTTSALLTFCVTSVSNLGLQPQCHSFIRQM